MIAIEAYLRASVRAWRGHEQVGPFLASFAKTSSNLFLNYAIPDDGAAPSPGDVAALTAVYERRMLTPWLEYIPDLAPAVEPALLAAGFQAEGRLALMGLATGAASADRAEGIELAIPATDAELLAVRAVQHDAYDEPDAPGEEAVRSLRRSIASGGGVVLARTVGDHVAVGGGEYTPSIGGVTEVTSIGVQAAYRRRGIAAAMTSWLAESARASGATTLFLMANEAEERIYATVGFVTDRPPGRRRES